ncbi:hypothetical protein OAS37_07440 [Alphaproteobacteria bacterium]|jgi:hypothetical protein|nr:hypothetical protein [Alphaproteobacteria bacterium]
MEILLLIIIILLICILVVTYWIFRLLGQTLIKQNKIGFGDKPNEVVSTSPYLGRILQHIEKIDEMMVEKKN